MTSLRRFCSISRKAARPRTEAAEREIDAALYKLFDLTPEEIALLEGSLAGQY
jgi:hypothetical protein